MFPTKHNFLDSLKQVLHQGIQRSLETLGCHNRGEVGGFLASSGWGPGMPCKCTEATARRMISFQMSAGAEAVVWRQVLNCWGPGGARRAGEARTAEQPGWARVRTHTPHATRHTPHATRRGLSGRCGVSHPALLIRAREHAVCMHSCSAGSTPSCLHLGCCAVLHLHFGGETRLKRTRGEL